MRKRTIKHPADIFVCFVSTFARVNLNNCYDFFLSGSLTLSDEKYFVSQISNFVREFSFEIWKLNVNYFFIIFDEFNKLNRSLCYEIKPNAKNTYKPLHASRFSTYYGELSVIPRSGYHLFSHGNHSSDFDSDSS